MPVWYVYKKPWFLVSRFESRINNCVWFLNPSMKSVIVIHFIATWIAIKSNKISRKNGREKIFIAMDLISWQFETNHVQCIAAKPIVSIWGWTPW